MNIAVYFQGGDASAGIAGVVVVALVAGLYFLPAIVAGVRHHRNSSAITVLNLFLGWTVLGWVIALVWASTADTQATPTSALVPCPLCGAPVAVVGNGTQHCTGCGARLRLKAQ